MKSKTRNIFIISLLTIILVVVVALAVVFKKNADSVASINADFQLDAVVFVNAFMQDENVADKLYLGKVIQIKGTIDEVVENAKDKKVTVSIKEPGAMSGVQCEFASGNINLKNIKVGNILKIKGICNGFLLDVVLTKCSVVE